jgi:hypothetical protein
MAREIFFSKKIEPADLDAIVAWLRTLPVVAVPALMQLRW